MTINKNCELMILLAPKGYQQSSEKGNKNEHRYRMKNSSAK